MDLLNEVSVTLVVKAPNQKVADQTVECALSWTVKKLKEHLALVYPSKPTENQQRIIYSGKLLQDDLTLEDVLCQHESSESVHTVHLVCSNSLTDISTSRSAPDLAQSLNLSHFSTSDGLRNRQPASSAIRQDEQENLSQQPHISSDCSPTMTNYGADRLQFQASAFHPSPYNMFTSSYLPSGTFNMMTPPSPPLSQSYTAEQLRWLQQQQQQAYAQYMSNYVQFLQQAGNGVGQPFNYAMPHFAAPTVPENAAQDRPANAAEEPVQPQPQQPQVVRLNAQGGRVDDDEDELDRDWLDWFYVGLRFALFMCILYFYSTPLRFITTLILMLFICCLQFGWLRYVGQRQQPAQLPANPPNANVAENPDGTRTVDPGALGREVPRQPVGGLSLAWSVFLSFFASLAPRPPPPINAN